MCCPGGWRQGNAVQPHVGHCVKSPEGQYSLFLDYKMCQCDSPRGKSGHESV